MLTNDTVTNDALPAVLRSLEDAPVLAVDLETTGLYPFHGDKILGVAISPDSHTGYYFPVGHTRPERPAQSPLGYTPPPEPEPENVPLDALRPLLSDPERVYIGHNIKFDLKFLHLAGIPLPKRIVDTRVAGSLNNENEPHGLKPLADKYLGAGSSDEQQELYAALAALGYTGKDRMRHLNELDPALVGKYAAQDTRLTFGLYELFCDRLRRFGLIGLWREYNRFLLALTRMELRGLKADRRRMAELEQEMHHKALRLENDFRRQANRGHVNLNSPKQLAAVLGTDATDYKTVRGLKDSGGDKAELAATLLQYRHYKKLETTYFEPYQGWIAQDGAIHPDLYLGGARTGRLSCREPNLQQIPREADTVKSVFAARPGFLLCEADYEQAELRLGAEIAVEPRMIKAFQRGDDPHQLTADQLGISRTQAKTVNFGIIYGMQAPGLASSLNIPLEAAEEYLDRFHREFPAFHRAYLEAKRQAESDGYVRLWTGRLRRLSGEETRKAFNSKIQGGVAEIVRRAITRIDQQHPEIRLLLTVHDSIIFEAPEDALANTVDKIASAMKADNRLFRVPQDVEVKYGVSWGKMRVYKN